MDIIFDLDDTLYKERDFIASAFRAVARYLTSKTKVDPLWLCSIIAAYRPKGFEAVLESIQGIPGAERITVPELVHVYRSHWPDIKLDPKVVCVLERLKAEGHGLGIITDGTVLTQSLKIKALGLDRFVEPDAIWISERTGGDKTTELPWRAAEKYFGHGGLVYVGDNLSKDFRLANQRGWHTVMVRDYDGVNVFPQRPSEWPAEYKAAETVDSIADII